MQQLLFVGLVLLVVAVVVIASHIQTRGWQEKWPPIDEDEFMARCPPGTDRVVALKVRRIISEQLGVDYNRVYPEQRFVEDLGCD